MKVVRIDKQDWAAGVEKSRDAYRLIGPVAVENKDFTEFKVLTKSELPDMANTGTRLSPKSIVFPPQETLMEYGTDETSEDCNRMKEAEKAYTPTAVLGIRPYDAAAFLLVKKNFDTPEYRDPYWCDAYEACTFIGLAVNHPSALDFSTSTGSGPFDERGVDVLLVDTGDQYLAKVITDKGDAYLKSAGWETEADATAEQTIGTLKEAAESKADSSVGYDNIKSASIMDLYEADYWEDVAFACINCGTCTYVCPTCWCFDIQDETNGKQGKRMKTWDSCMFPLFTIHTTGHNPRGTKVQRVRQRFMHKLKYFLDKYDDGIMCVGCGRCIQSCPVNIDIRKVCATMNAADQGVDACAVK
jgi:sulfhydrogenase subunit beta (sulfur reductase)